MPGISQVYPRGWTPTGVDAWRAEQGPLPPRHGEPLTRGQCRARPGRHLPHPGTLGEAVPPRSLPGDHGVEGGADTSTCCLLPSPGVRRQPPTL
jgi:hypothetical protein